MYILIQIFNRKTYLYVTYFIKSEKLSTIHYTTKGRKNTLSEAITQCFPTNLWVVKKINMCLFDPVKYDMNHFLWFYQHIINT